MKRMLALAMVLSLASAACGADSPSVPGNGTVENGENGNGDGGGNGGNGNGGNGGGGSGGINQAPEGVTPVLPEEGERSTLAAEVLRQSTDPIDEFVDPVMLLLRNPEAAERAASEAPLSGVADAIRSWSDYRSRAVIVVYGGPQPDDGHSIAFDKVTITRGGLDLTTFAAIQSGKARREQVSMPWLVLTVPANAVVLAKKCFLAFEGQAAVETRC